MYFLNLNKDYFIALKKDNDLISKDKKSYFFISYIPSLFSSLYIGTYYSCAKKKNKIKINIKLVIFSHSDIEVSFKNSKLKLF